MISHINIEAILSGKIAEISPISLVSYAEKKEKKNPERDWYF